MWIHDEECARIWVDLSRKLGYRNKTSQGQSSKWWPRHPVETLSKFGRPKIDGHHELGHLPITCQFGGYVPHGYIQNLCLVPHVENCRTLQNPPEIAQVSRSQATGHNYEALESESLNFLLIFIHLPETGRLTRAVNRVNGFSVRKNPVRSTGGRKGWRTIFQRLWRVHLSCLSIGNKTANKKLESHLIDVAPGRKARKITEQLCFYKGLPLVWVVSWSKGLQFKVIAEPHFEHTYHGYLEPFRFSPQRFLWFFFRNQVQSTCPFP